MKSITFNKKKLSYKKKGKGLPLIFLHGFGEDSRVWDEFVEKFVEDYKVIRIDLPGFGQSDAGEDMTISKMANGVHAVLEKLEVKQCVLIGHSMGGYVSLAFAERHENMLLGLGMFHSQPFADTEEKKKGRQKGIDFIRKYGHSLYIKQLIPALFAKSFANDNQVLIERLTFQANQYESEGIIGGLEAMKNRPDRSEGLKKIKCPVLFIVGKEDQAIPEQNSLEQVHLPDVASIHILPKVGHMGMYEAKKKCTKIIKDFISFVDTHENT